jgi:Holliday junction resolvase RusA-like endonuclease
MSRTLSFFVPIIPKGQARHRVVRRGAHIATYDPSVDWKAQFAALAAQHIGSEPPFEQGVPLGVWIDAYFPRPKRLLTKKSDQYLIPYTSKPDGDNVAKIVLDALAPWMHDDAQVSDLRVLKWWVATRGEDSTVPGIRVRIKEIRESEF